MFELHPYKKRQNLFQGWYFKHQSPSQTLCLIPGAQQEKDGSRSAFLQVITQDHSYQVGYPFDKLKAYHGNHTLQLGLSRFGREGVHLDVRTPDLCLTGDLAYGPFAPLSSPIMGPFRFLPRMECSHGVLSMHHRVTGELQLNGTPYAFDDAIGYIESDWGDSFPQEYLWTQDIQPQLPLSIMLAIARVPVYGIVFLGCICEIHLGTKRYRLATYRGARVVSFDCRHAVLSQGKYRLEVFLETKDNSKPLQAPVSGRMSRTIGESARCRVTYRLFENHTLLYGWTSDAASFEYVPPAPSLLQ